MSNESSTDRASGIIGNAELTHGTLETRGLVDSRWFFEEVMGLRCVRHSPVSQLLAGRGGVGVVCVETASAAHAQGEENRWVILVSSDDAVEKIYHAAAGGGMVAELRPVAREGGTSRFLMRDRDGNWWEISNLSPGHYQSIFERGDIRSL